MELLIDAGALLLLFAALYGLADSHAERDSFRLLYLLALLIGLQAVLSLFLLGQQ